MRVLIYAPAMYPKVDGVALRVGHHVRQLHEMKQQVLILTPIAEAPDEYEGAQVIKLPSFSPLDYAESKISYPFPVVTLWRVFRAFKPDIVHFIGPEFVFIPMVVACKYFNVPLIGSYHFYVEAFLARLPAYKRLALGWFSWIEFNYNLADYVITPSKPMLTILHQKRMRCDDVWPPAVDAEQFHPRHRSEEMRSRLTFGHPEATLILYVGRVCQEKSMELLPNLLSINDNTYLAIIGGGPDVPKWLPRHGERNRIFCSGEHWCGNKLAQAYASADIFVIPSNFETLGNVVLEAMASGIPVVGSAAGGIPHMIVHNVTGLLFRPNHIEDMIDAVRTLINDKPLATRLSAAGRKYAQSITWQAASEAVVGIYKHVIKEHGKLVPGVNAPPDPMPPSLELPYITGFPSRPHQGRGFFSYSWLPWLICTIFCILGMMTYARAAQIKMSS